MNGSPQPDSREASPDSAATSPTLLSRVRRNQAGAWEQLVDLYAPLVYHWCKRSVPVLEDSADIFQEVFRSLAEHIGEFRRDRPGDTFRGWLRTITGNKIRDHFRKVQGREQAVGGTDAQIRMQAMPDAASDEPDPAEGGLIHWQVRRALESLQGEFEPRTWQAFWFVQMDERSTDDVGAELGMTPAAVRKAKFRVLRRLREYLGGLLE